MKISLLLLTCILLIGLVSAESIGTFRQSSDIELYQTCNNCTYCNLTSIKYPNSTDIFTNLGMAKDGTYYSYSLILNYTSILGTYTYCYDCGNDVEKDTGCIDFEVTPNGRDKPDGITVVFFSISFLAVIGFLSYLFIYNLGHMAQMDYDLGDLIKNVSAFFVLVGLYLLSTFYMGNEMIDNIMVWIIGITGFTNVAMSFMFFMICLLAQRKQRIENAW